MSRLFIFLLGLLVGAAAIYFLAARGYVSIAAPAVTVVAPLALPPSQATLPATPARPVQTPTISDLGTPPALPVTEPGIMPSTPLPAIAADPARLASTSGLLLPVAGIQASQLSDTYTQSRGEGRSHDAIDIMAPRGTPVVAVADGRVAKLFDSKQGGLTVYQFDSGETIAYYYAHLDSYAAGVVEGKQLKRGDLVGYVGSTGNANPDGPHLHFAVFLLGPEKNWWQGTPVNPYPLLGGRASKGG